jgi:hypothetical protein
MSPDFARFKEPEEEAAVAYCAWCGGEIYAGDEVRRVDESGRFVHDVAAYVDCAKEYASERVYDAIGTISERGEIE